jgi:hypothetical protein
MSVKKKSSGRKRHARKKSPSPREPVRSFGLVADDRPSSGDSHDDRPSSGGSSDDRPSSEDNADEGDDSPHS